MVKLLPELVLGYTEGYAHRTHDEVIGIWRGKYGDESWITFGGSLKGTFSAKDFDVGRRALEVFCGAYVTK